MTELQDRTTDDQPVADGGRPGNAETADVVLATADAVFHSLWEGQDAAAGVVRQWAGRLVGVPFHRLERRWRVTRVRPGMGRLHVQMVDALVDMQRRSVLQIVGLQRRTAGMLASTITGGSARHPTAELPRPRP